MIKKYALGLDFGTNSCRSLIVDLENGNKMEMKPQVLYSPIPPEIMASSSMPKIPISPGKIPGIT